MKSQRAPLEKNISLPCTRRGPGRWAARFSPLRRFLARIRGRSRGGARLIKYPLFISPLNRCARGRVGRFHSPPSSPPLSKGGRWLSSVVAPRHGMKNFYESRGAATSGRSPCRVDVHTGATTSRRPAQDTGLRYIYICPGQSLWWPIAFQLSSEKSPMH